MIFASIYEIMRSRDERERERVVLAAADRLIFGCFCPETPLLIYFSELLMLTLVLSWMGGNKIGKG
jgi:hypothetical protein